ncbi:esterase/lipase family protein [Rubritalea sp.]|uniref:esterase/lipase family protein n=1 Tax=Rubritalea sp. TaxID=2109375 RepID=UPI003EF11A40
MKLFDALKVTSLAVTLALVSCSSPSVDVLDNPSVSAPLRTSFSGKKISSEAKLYLQEHGLKDEYRRDPEQAILTLREQVKSIGSLEGQCVLAELCGDLGARYQRKNKEKSLGYFLASAEVAYPHLSQSITGGMEKRFISIYNLGTANIVNSMVPSILRGDTPDRFSVKGPWRTYSCQWDTQGEENRSPRDFDSIYLARDVPVKGIDKGQRHIFNGAGAAMVAHQRQTESRLKEDAFMSAEGMAIPVTAVSVFTNGGSKVKLSLVDMYKTQDARLNGERIALAADYTTPVALLLDYEPTKLFGFKRLLHPEEYMDTCQLDEITPFDDGKIPLIFVHGLASCPAVWLDAINKVMGDPRLRDRYQILVYSYPTGFPISYNSSLFRDWLKRYHDHYDSPSYRANFREMVLVGHSMGCLLSNAQIRSSGDRILDLLLTKPLDEIDGLSAKEKETVRHINVYEANQDISRVVFMAGPHRGSNLASDFIGKLGIKLIQMPQTILSYSLDKKVKGLTELGKRRLHHVPNSISDLRPNEPYLMTVLEEPLSDRVRYHSIIGKFISFEPLLESSDTVVPYWSSHMKNAESEKVVHGMHTQIPMNKDNIDEMCRILLLHVGEE